MLQRIFRWTAVALLTTIGLVPAQADPGDYRVRVGEYHPDLTLPSIEDGKPISLRQMRGKKTLLIHFASW